MRHKPLSILIDLIITITMLVITAVLLSQSTTASHAVSLALCAIACVLHIRMLFAPSQRTGLLSVVVATIGAGVAVWFGHSLLAVGLIALLVIGLVRIAHLRPQPAPMTDTSTQPLAAPRVQHYHIDRHHHPEHATPPR